MKPQEPRIFKYFLGDREALILERRVLNALILSSSLLATLLFFEALAFHEQNALVLSLLATSILWGVYLYSKSSQKTDWPLWIYLSAIGLIILADRFFVGGFAGLSLLILVAISGTIPLITRKDQLKIAAFLLIFFFIVICALTAIYWQRIPAAPPYRKDLMVQIIEAGVLVACLFSVAYLAISNYRHEKNLALSLNRELNRKNESLEKSNRELELAYKEINTLRGLLPTCSYCKKIRPDNIRPNESINWVPIERYIEQHTDAVFSHGICPECLKEHFGEEMYNKVFTRPG
ncbi:MAG: hypothetical protein JRF07_00130 [Deltaproteobacteria bacterium]|jgi:hypothetical protein|nr:hypothetical protein [Deltaproteobacteria bacterium]